MSSRCITRSNTSKIRSAILVTIRRWMAGEGVLLIEVPNVEARCIAPAHRFHFAHFYSFNRETLEALGRKAGFEPVRTTTSAGRRQPGAVFRQPPARRPVDCRGEITPGLPAPSGARPRSGITCSAAPVRRVPWQAASLSRRSTAQHEAARRLEGRARPPDQQERSTTVSEPTEYVIPVEYASQRKIRTRNKLHYRFNHWPIWIFVFFIAPGPLTFDLFERGFDRRMVAWLGVVCSATGIAGLRGRLPGVEPAPYIIRFTEDRPNPLYRRVCYTFAWSAAITFAVLNIAGLLVAIVTGEWYLKQIYRYALLSDRGSRLAARPAGEAPARDAFDQRRRARAALLLRHGMGDVHRPAGAVAHVVHRAGHASGATRSSCSSFSGFWRCVGNLARLGRLPRTRPIVPGELAVSD